MERRDSFLRRDVLRGGVVVGGVIGIAGCAGDSRENDDPETEPSPETTPNDNSDGSGIDNTATQNEGDDGSGNSDQELEGDGQYIIGSDDLPENLEIDGPLELQYRPPRMSSFSLDAQFEEYGAREITGYEEDKYSSEPGQYVLDASDGAPNALIIPLRSLDDDKLISVTFDIYVDADFAEVVSPVNVGWAQIANREREVVKSGFRSMPFDEQVAPGIARAMITLDNETPEGGFVWQAGVGNFGEDAVSSSVPFEIDAPALFGYIQM